MVCQKLLASGKIINQLLVDLCYLYYSSVVNSSLDGLVFYVIGMLGGILKTFTRGPAFTSCIMQTAKPFLLPRILSSRHFKQRCFFYFCDHHSVSCNQTTMITFLKYLIILLRQKKTKVKKFMSAHGTRSLVFCMKVLCKIHSAMGDQIYKFYKNKVDSDTGADPGGTEETRLLKTM